MPKQVIPKTFNFKFVKASDFKTTGINGVFGGINIRGHLNMNFYIDTVFVPEEIKHNVTATGKLGTEIPLDSTSEGIALREIPFGVTFDISAAKSIIQWMQKHVDAYEANQLTQKATDETIK